MSKEQNKNYGKSIRTKLLNVARKENVFNQTILTRYFQERLLYRISQTHYRGNFYLKGGALMYAYENLRLVQHWISISLAIISATKALL